jgi:hypothetical protein
MMSEQECTANALAADGQAQLFRIARSCRWLANQARWQDAFAKRL